MKTIIFIVFIALAMIAATATTQISEASVKDKRKVYCQEGGTGCFSMDKEQAEAVCDKFFNSECHNTKGACEETFDTKCERNKDLEP
jgi:hypothetical protein